ncbi:serine protease Do [Pelagirhabdus alkalitolerans]|uniref:Serine protease Do n=1 Tax=Pelagirhabdus alkalitolerans TaxID=1612202 RepID=A0A1G6LH17_9BACI|nr:trypsin-like peptidase domain-containing protein [Pelagirhabdus alkalitolerans]SDC42055.1 serine protease Do [Pelagirhabdus alkalitolerans]
MVYYDDGSRKRRRNRFNQTNRGYLLLFLMVGTLVGAFLFAVFLPMMAANNWLPYHVSVEPEPNSQTEPFLDDPSSDALTPVNLDISTQLTSVVENVMPTVVGVETIQSQYPAFWERSGGEGGSGSGVIYSVDDTRAYIVTNHHVIEGARDIDVILETDERIEATLEGSDLFTDLAVLSVDANGIDQAIELGDSTLTKVGEQVIAIGNPLGLNLSGSVTQGIISGTQRAIPQDFSGDGRADWQAEVMQTDAAINPGNSGGALINMSGQLIGINSMKIAQSAVEGIGFAIPIAEAIPVIEELEAEGEVTRAYLGVEAYALSDLPPEEHTNRFNLPTSVEHGVYLQSVEAFSPAAEAGLKADDVITELDGTSVFSIVDLRQHLYQRKQPGDEMTVTFYSEGEQQTVTVELSTQP